MSHFAILSPPDAGHLYPLGALGRELVRRGHRVTVVAHARGAALTEHLGLPLHPLNGDDISYSSSPFLERAFDLVGAGGLFSLREWLPWEAEVTLQLVPNILRELSVDGVICDQVLAAGGTAAEHVGLPFVTVSSALHWNEEPGVPPPYTIWPYAAGMRARLRNRMGYVGWRWFKRPIIKVINRHRKAWNLRPFKLIDDSFSPLAQISQLFMEFDFPRRALPAQFHYVGSLAANRGVVEPPFPWERLDGRPLIYASLGTVADSMNRPVFPKIAAACEGLNAQLVLARGKWDEEEAGREDSYDLPGQPLVVDFAPQLALLERAAMLITHAGLNTVLEAISCAVPMVAMPRNADQPANASRVAYSGAGLLAPFHNGTAKQVQQVIERVLTEDQFRHRAKELQTAMIAAGGVSHAADITEEALATGSPVLRRQPASARMDPVTAA